MPPSEPCALCAGSGWLVYRTAGRKAYVRPGVCSEWAREAKDGPCPNGCYPNTTKEVP